MGVGAEVLAQADQLESASRVCISRGNKLRRRLGELRVQQRQSTVPARPAPVVHGARASTAVVDDALGALAEQIEQWQTEGAALRSRSQALREASARLLIDGFDTRWSGWISNPAPLVMETADDQVVAHNNQIRSVHPTLSGITPATPRYAPEAPRDVDSGAPAHRTKARPIRSNVSSFQVSRSRSFFTHIEVEPDGAGRAATVPLNRIHKWRLLVTEPGRATDR